MSEIPKVQVRRFSRGRHAAADGAVSEPTPPTVVAVEEEEDVPDVSGYMSDNEEDDFLADLKTPVEQVVAEPKTVPTPVNTPEPPPKKLYESGREFTDDHLLKGIFDQPAAAAKPKRGGGGGKKNSGGFADIFGSSPTPLLGADRRVLLTKISEYKALFADIPLVKAFKVKANASDEELQRALDELETIVNCGSIQSLTDEMILSAVRIVEGVSSRTQSLNITGTADLLKQNPEFYKLSKMLTIKYRVFSQLPPEYQMLLLVMSTAMVARQKNLRSAEVASMLNQPF